MNSKFTLDQMKLIRGWDHDLRNTLGNIRYVHEQLKDDATIRARIVSIQGSSIDEIEKLLTSMQSILEERNLDEVANV